jgi:hypothetical protein
LTAIQVFFGGVNRTAALYEISARELLNRSDSDWDWELCVPPSTSVLRRLAEMKRLPCEMLQDSAMAPFFNAFVFH